jgi:exopolyphosphatase
MYHIPLSNLQRDDLSIRPELDPVLQHANITPKDLITLSDLPPLKRRKSLLPPNQTRWLLVDHNLLNGELGKDYSDRVVGCIDHHDEENVVPLECHPEPRIVKVCGSSASLIVEACKDVWNALPKGNDELERLALAPILVDTTELKNTHKVMPADTDAVEYLERRIIKVETGYDRKKFYEQLISAKNHIEHLNLRDILRKDYKDFSKQDMLLGTCAVVKNLDFLIQKAGNEKLLLDAIFQFAKERKLSLFALMTVWTQENGDCGRELMVWGLDSAGIAAAKTFDQKSAAKLGLELLFENLDGLHEHGGWRRCWRQKRTENSRKQIAPMLREAML